MDQLMARQIRDMPADCISLKLAINSTTVLSERTFASTVLGFLLTIRDGHPTTPIVIVSPIICPSLEDDVHPADLKLFSFLPLRQMRRQLADLVSKLQLAGDHHVFYLNGLELFGERDLPNLPDGVHPNGDGYELMGRRFAHLEFGPAGRLLRDRATVGPAL
eukprot:gnl/TRDRNA2_/TRDRNA2_162898_c3_seq2.p1 gnl/TRDRNA2_/TRDRNA2_162898_c3~~gnl/TRDRNA2_/TRDRNA2_162898_c3_seq2.p1  ORF type:complete len:162 (-),score=20.74 gnl/TRDRNA2_/TRDRNA2_162898_c3_seq2:14-499(-)